MEQSSAGIWRLKRTEDLENTYNENIKIIISKELKPIHREQI
jgi:hypothetical protein